MAQVILLLQNESTGAWIQYHLKKYQLFQPDESMILAPLALMQEIQEVLEL